MGIMQNYKLRLKAWFSHGLSHIHIIIVLELLPLSSKFNEITVRCASINLVSIQLLNRQRYVLHTQQEAKVKPTTPTHHILINLNNHSQSH